ncbi:MAG: single-stranded DNA-binding protein [Planctomycetota bacterium]
MGNVNKVFLMGNMTRDPELRYTPSGTPVCDIGMAINRRYSTQGGEQREETCFVDVTFWGRRAEVVSEYFAKGDPIFVEGRLQLDQWETSEGNRSKLKVVARNFEFVGPASGSGASGGADAPRGGRGGGGGESEPSRRTQRSGGGQGSGQGQQQRAPQQQNNGGAGPEEPVEDEFDVSDDEIPF